MILIFVGLIIHVNIFFINNILFLYINKNRIKNLITNIYIRKYRNSEKEDFYIINYYVDNNVSYDLNKLFKTKIKNLFDDYGKYIKGTDYAQFLMLFFKYNMKFEDIFNDKTYYKLTTYDDINILTDVLNKLPEEYNQDIIDKYCEEWITKELNIDDFKYNSGWLFSDKIKDKYEYIINAKKFDLI